MKTRGTLWKVSVSTTTEAEEAVTELLNEIFGWPVSSYTDVETREVTVATYLPAEELKKRPRAAAVSRHGGTSVIREGVRRIKACGLDVGSGKILLRKIRREDWAESWKRHFKPIEIGLALLIKPSWAKRRPQKGQAVIVLDPGLSFGTGQHPRTGFCLREIVEASLSEPVVPPNAARTAQRTVAATKKSFLDIGTGSGILAIAAAKLGFAPVDAFDFDPESVRIAKENARKNGVARKINITQADVAKLPLRSQKQYDLVCANLISTLLVVEQKRILSRLKRDGVLVIAGILKTEFDYVEQMYERAGLKLIAARTEKEWRSGAFIYRRSER
ncbi:MAG TPA: 50S ribosomal protein L11 methyltransferase [Candidatus Polarisedimenticolia bacterium]|nr:50S ribosomal protein L11 methyltransferase [Candidatus Polarisedimenticolia bacterium]